MTIDYAAELKAQLWLLSDEYLIRAIDYVSKRQPMRPGQYGDDLFGDNASTDGCLVGISVPLNEITGDADIIEGKEGVYRPLELAFDAFWLSFGEDTSVYGDLFEPRMATLEAILTDEFKSRLGFDKIYTFEALVEQLLEEPVTV